MEQPARAVIGATNADFIIAGWTVDLSTLRLYRAGKSVKLEPKAMAVLKYLARRPGQVVSRQELEEFVWAGTVVGYDAISNAIIKLRKAFGDDAQKPEVIETIPKTGYRLIAPVEPNPECLPPESGAKTVPNVVQLSAAPAAPARWKIITTISAPLMLLISLVSLWMEPWVTRIEPASVEHMELPLPEKTSVAVWPFANLSADKTQQYYVDGITQDLITRLSKFPDLFVVAPNSTFNYQGSEVGIRQFAEELSVHHVIKGSVQLAREKLRINVHLIDALSGERIWAETYDGTTEDVFALQDRVTAGVGEQLALDLNLQFEPPVDSQRANYAEIYDLYFRGWSHFRAGTAEDYKQAIDFFRQSLDRDPEFKRAEAALTAVYWNILVKGMWQESLGLDYYRSFELTRKTLRSSQRNPTALTLQIASEWVTYFSSGSRTPERALTFAEQAIAMAPNNPAGYLAKASALLKDDQAGAAQVEIRTAMRLDPHYPSEYLVRLGQTQIQLGEYEAAVQSLEQAISSNPYDSWAQLYLAAVYGLSNRKQEARSALLQAERMRARDGWGTVTLVSTAQAYFRWQGSRDRLKQGLKAAGARVGGEWFGLIKYTPVGQPNLVEGATLVNAREAKELHDRGGVFIHVAGTWLKSRIPGSHFLEWWSEGWMFNEASLGRIANADSEIVIYSHDLKGKRTAQAAAFAVSRGFKNVYHFPGGVDEWRAVGYPLEEPD